MTVLLEVDTDNKGISSYIDCLDRGGTGNKVRRSNNDCLTGGGHR